MNETSDSDKPEAATPSPPMLTEGKPEILQPQRNSGRLADKWMTRRGGLKFPEVTMRLYYKLTTYVRSTSICDLFFCAFWKKLK